MRRNWFLTLIAGLLASTVLSCSPANEDSREQKGMITKESALEIAREAFVASHGDQIREFKISESAQDFDDGYWEFFAEGTGEYARPGFHAIIEVGKKTGQATVIRGE
jgi:hypothetical protein